LSSKSSFLIYIVVFNVKHMILLLFSIILFMTIFYNSTFNESANYYDSVHEIYEESLIKDTGLLRGKVSKSFKYYMCKKKYIEFFLLDIGFITFSFKSWRRQGFPYSICNDMTIVFCDRFFKWKLQLLGFFKFLKMMWKETNQKTI
jgi:hypothetical protein